MGTFYRSPWLSYLILLSALFLLPFCTGGDRQREAASNDTSTPVNPSKRPVRDCVKLKTSALQMDSLLLAAVEAHDSTGIKAVTAFMAFANNCPYDSLSPVYLIKAAQVARAVDRLPQARNALEICIREHKDFRDRPAAIFLLAQLFEEHSFMQDRDEAHKLYDQIIEEYPKSVWAQNAKAATQMIGKSEEEIIQMLKGKK